MNPITKMGCSLTLEQGHHNLARKQTTFKILRILGSRARSVPRLKIYGCTDKEVQSTLEFSFSKLYFIKPLAWGKAANWRTWSLFRSNCRNSASPLMFLFRSWIKACLFLNGSPRGLQSITVKYV
jgi:hypothetical protein